MQTLRVAANSLKGKLRILAKCGLVYAVRLTGKFSPEDEEFWEDAYAMMTENSFQATITVELCKNWSAVERPETVAMKIVIMLDQIKNLEKAIEDENLKLIAYLLDDEEYEINEDVMKFAAKVPSTKAAAMKCGLFKEAKLRQLKSRKERAKSSLDFVHSGLQGLFGREKACNGVSICTSCKNVWNRDINATLNFSRCVRSMLKEGSRPGYLQRESNPTSSGIIEESVDPHLPPPQ